MEPDGRPSHLTGRSGECARIDDLLAGAVEGRSGALVLRGEAGIGKSALLRYAIDRAAGMRRLQVTGVEAESDLAFAGLHALTWPIIESLERVPEPQRAAVAAALGLAPGSGSDRFLVSAGALSLLAAAAEARPLLCTVDDAQWLDVPSADALVFAARRVVAEGIVLLFGVREGEGEQFAAAGLDELVLTGLDRESAAILLDGGGSRMAAAVRARLLAEAAGNPLALLELPSGLSQAQLGGRDELPAALPLTGRLRAVFTDRTQRLPDRTRTALLVAGAEQTGRPGALLAALTALGLGPEDLDGAVRTGLLQNQADKVVFRHPVIRSIVVDSAVPAQRRQVHAALADALEADDPDRALWHRAMATTAPDEPIAAALEMSAHRARRDGGHASAASALERAADLGERSARGGRLGAAAQAAHAAGQASRARALISRALPLLDAGQHAPLLFLQGLIEGQHGWIPDGVATLAAAAAASHDPSLTLQILREACGMAFWAADYEQAAILGGRAAGLPRSTDLDAFNATVIMAPAAELAGDHDRAAALSADAIMLAERLDDPRCLIAAAMAAGREGGSAGAGLPYAARAVDFSRRRGLPSVLCAALWVQGSALVSQGRLDLAYSTSEEGRRLALDVGQPWVAGQNLTTLALIDAIRGNEDCAKAELAELRTLVTRSGAALLGGHLDRTTALLELGQGRPDAAVDRLLPVVTAARPEENPLFALGLPDAVEAAVRADRLSDIGTQLQRYHDWTRRSPTPARRALDARCRALTASADAEEHFRQALDLSDALGPFERARTSLLYGEWLRRRRRRGDARRHLHAALELFQQLRATPWETRARTELRATGETARRRDAISTDELTPQELQIARMVADGMTNPDVAAQLFLSPRTIDYHLRKVFTKLSIASRTELASLNLGDA